MADLEQERVTALWREAAAALDQPQVRDEWPAFTENFYRDPTTRQWVYRWSDARIVVAGEDCAGCGRLREQLDAARQTAESVEAESVAVRRGTYWKVAVSLKSRMRVWKECVDRPAN